MSISVKILFRESKRILFSPNLRFTWEETVMINSGKIGIILLLCIRNGSVAWLVVIRLLLLWMENENKPHNFSHNRNNHGHRMVKTMVQLLACYQEMYLLFIFLNLSFVRNTFQTYRRCECVYGSSRRKRTSRIYHDNMYLCMYPCRSVSM